jgi:nitroreductase
MSTCRAREAAIAIEAGLRALREASDSIGIADSFDMLSDVVALRSMRDALVPQLPPAQRSELEARLRAAIVAENYELAAILRDELRML